MCRERAKLHDRSAKRCATAHRSNICDLATSIAIYLRIDSLEHDSSSTQPRRALYNREKSFRS